VVYLLAYAFMNFGAFGIILYLERDGNAGTGLDTSTASFTAGPSRLSS